MDSQGAAVRRISHYSSDMHILLVGEGDFSFAAALARAFHTAPRLLATSLDSREMLHMNYGGLIMEIRLAELSLRYAVVMNEVNVKTVGHHPSLRHLSFDRIIYNFPHSGFVYGLNEGDKALIRKHRQLMRSFFKNVRSILKDGGEVHVVHHMSKPYSEWRLEEEAAKSGFKLRACYEFEAQGFPGYTPRRGAGTNANGTFPLHNPYTFIFFIPQIPPPCPPCIIPSHPPPPPPCNIIPLTSPLPRPLMTDCRPSITSPACGHPSPLHLPRSSNAISTRMSSLHIHPFPSTTITPPKPSLIVSHSPPSPPPNIISTHDHNNYLSTNSHRESYNHPPSSFKTSSHPECSQPSASSPKTSEPFSWISTLGKIIKFFIDHSSGEG